MNSKVVKIGRFAYLLPYIIMPFIVMMDIAIYLLVWGVLMLANKSNG